MGPAASNTINLPNLSAHDKICQLAEYFTEQTNEKTLTFLLNVGNNNPAALDKLLAKLKRNAIQQKLLIKAAHVDKVVELLTKQMELPINCLAAIDDHIAKHENFNIAAIINFVEILETSQLFERTMQVVTKLNVLNQENSRNRFLITIISIIIRLHEIDQENNNELDDFHEKSASKIATWIKTTLTITENSELSLLINFLIDHVLVLGKTRIDGASRTMNLSELFFMFEELATQAKFMTAKKSNVQLVNDINVMMLTIGVCDINPIAFYDVVSQQSHETKPMIDALKQGEGNCLLLEKFLKSGEFNRYFGNRDTMNAINQQAFLMSLTSYLSLCFAPNYTGSHDPARFIELCKKKRAALKDDAKFMFWFKREFSAQETSNCFESLFLSAIENESTYHLNHVGSLVFAANKLVSMGFSPRSATAASAGVFQPLISPDAPLITAKNLKSMRSFYTKLDKIQQQKFIAELVLMAIIYKHEKRARNYFKFKKYEKRKRHRKSIILSSTAHSMQKRHYRQADDRETERRDRFFPTVTCNHRPTQLDKVTTSKETTKHTQINVPQV